MEDFVIMSNISFSRTVNTSFPITLNHLIVSTEEKIGATGRELTKLADTSLGSYSMCTALPASFLVLDEWAISTPVQDQFPCMP